MGQVTFVVVGDSGRGVFLHVGEQDDTAIREKLIGSEAALQGV